MHFDNCAILHSEGVGNACGIVEWEELRDWKLRQGFSSPSSSHPSDLDSVLTLRAMDCLEQSED